MTSRNSIAPIFHFAVWPTSAMSSGSSENVPVTSKLAPSTGNAHGRQRTVTACAAEAPPRQTPSITSVRTHAMHQLSMPVVDQLLLGYFRDNQAAPREPSP